MLELREEPQVAEALAEACNKWPRTEDAWEAITWVLSKDPKLCGTPLNETGNLRVMIYAGAKSIGMPDIRLIYRISNPTIELLDAEFTEPKYAAAGHG